MRNFRVGDKVILNRSRSLPDIVKNYGKFTIYKIDEHGVLYTTRDKTSTCYEFKAEHIEFASSRNIKVYLNGTGKSY